jgi:hypothetical protein
VTLRVKHSYLLPKFSVHNLYRFYKVGVVGDNSGVHPSDQTEGQVTFSSKGLYTSSQQRREKDARKIPFTGVQAPSM